MPDATSLIAAVREAVQTDPACGGRISSGTMDFIETAIAGSAERREAVAAAHQATDAAAEFLRFADEGAASDRFPFEYDPVEKIVEATSRAAAIERAYMVTSGEDTGAPDAEGIAKLDALISACSSFLAGWA